ncbi:MAG: hypothetical protein ACLT2Z_02350 [Eubacterium sp.]
MGFIEQLKEKARANRKNSTSGRNGRRTYAAAEQIVREDFADIILLATDEEVEKFGKEYDIKVLQSLIQENMKNRSLCGRVL